MTDRPPSPSEPASYFSDRCGRSIEVQRDTFVPCGLKLGHDGDCEPVKLGAQSVSEPVRPAAQPALDREAARLAEAKSVMRGYLGECRHGPPMCMRCASRTVLDALSAMQERAEQAERDRDVARSYSDVDTEAAVAAFARAMAAERRVEGLQAQLAEAMDLLNRYPVPDGRPQLKYRKLVKLVAASAEAGDAGEAAT